MRNRIDPAGLDLSKEVVVQVKRVSKVVKGGKRFGFAALVVVGDGQGVVGVGIGKASDNTDAIRKGNEEARKNLIRVPLMGTTIPHPVNSFYGAANVVLRPAAPGTGVIAGSAVRAVVECAGIDNIVTKSIGSTNKINIVYSTIKGLASLFNRLPATVVKKLSSWSVRKLLPSWSRAPIAYRIQKRLKPSKI